MTYSFENFVDLIYPILYKTLKIYTLLGYISSMKTLAIISEFNPFHNGHEYLLKKSKELTQSDLAISLMSGDFVQRGEPAIVDKFSRADMAMKAGFDMVTEIPTHISLQSAEYFALGSIKILDKLNVDYLCFGIENMDSGDFLEKAQNLLENEDLLEELTKKYLENSSFTKARYDATVEVLGDDGFITSNNILALEYMRAIRKIGSAMTPTPIKRISSANADKSLLDSKISSSTAIRNNILVNYKDHVPAYSYELIEESKNKFGIPNMDIIYDIFRFLLLLERRPMAGILAYEEGLENYLTKVCQNNHNFSSFIDEATNKRYTSSRIKRLMINYILENKPTFNGYDINFYKVLAFNNKAELIFKNTRSKPVIRKKDYDNISITDQIILSQMIDSSNLYSLCQKRDFNIDYSKKIRRY